MISQYQELKSGRGTLDHLRNMRVCTRGERAGEGEGGEREGLYNWVISQYQELKSGRGTLDHLRNMRVCPGGTGGGGVGEGEGRK